MQHDWDKNLLALAKHVAGWSKDPSTKVGAVVVAKDDRRKIAHGYNGFPPGIEDTHDRLNHRPTKYRLVVHAERNALDNATFEVTDGTLYCTVHPCRECAKSIISRRIARVVTNPIPPVVPGTWTEEIPEARALLAEAGVEVTVLDPDERGEIPF